MSIRILALADIHSPEHLGKFRIQLENSSSHVKDVDLVLIAGDLMDKGNVSGYKQLINCLMKYFDLSKVIACPGNEDYDEVVNKLVSSSEIKWLIDDEVVLNLGSIKVRIFGSRGAIDRPTTWQRKHISNIDEIYRLRVDKVRKFVEKLCNEFKILLLHYAPTVKTLEGEDPKIWPYLARREIEKYLQNNSCIVIHGHAHNSNKRCVVIGKSIVLNVSFPKFWKLYMIELSSNKGRVDEVKVYELPEKKLVLSHRFQYGGITEFF